MLPTFPIYAIAERSQEPGIAQAVRWQAAILDDDTRALPVFNTFDQANAAYYGKGVSAIPIKNAEKFVAALTEARDYGIDRICWNLRPDGTCESVQPISEILR